jgi:hypothetical protein
MGTFTRGFKNHLVAHVNPTVLEISLDEKISRLALCSSANHVPRLEQALSVTNVMPLNAPKTRPNMELPNETDGRVEKIQNCATKRHFDPLKKS